MLEVPDKPFAATFEEWDEWRTAARKKHPVRYFLSETLPLELSCLWRRYVHNPWYYVKCRLWHRYNVVVCRDLPPTWNDRDDVLLHASFQLLKDYVEREDRAGGYAGHTQKTREELIADYHYTNDPAFWTEQQIAEGREFAEKRADSWLEVRALYDWWEGRRLVDDEDDDQYDIDNGMLKRLADVRSHLWT